LIWPSSEGEEAVGPGKLAGQVGVREPATKGFEAGGVDGQGGWVMGCIWVMGSGTGSTVGVFYWNGRVLRADVEYGPNKQPREFAIIEKSFGIACLLDFVRSLLEGLSCSGQRGAFDASSSILLHSPL
jgi:hypothetical protein